MDSPEHHHISETSLCSGTLMALKASAHFPKSVPAWKAWAKPGTLSITRLLAWRPSTLKHGGKLSSALVSPLAASIFKSFIYKVLFQLELPLQEQHSVGTALAQQNWAWSTTCTGKMLLDQPPSMSLSIFKVFKGLQIPEKWTRGQHTIISYFHNLSRF